MPRPQIVPTPTPRHPLPELVIDSGDEASAMTRLGQMIAARCAHRIFIYDDNGPIIIERDEGGRVLMVPLSAHLVVHEGQKIVRPFWRGKKQTPGKRALTRWQADLCLAVARRWGLRRIIAVTTAPIFYHDGTIRTAAGYDARSQLYCESVGLDVEDKPRHEDAQAALKRLRHWLRYFVFKDRIIKAGTDETDLGQNPGRNESVALNGLMTCVLRSSMLKAPGFAIWAPNLVGSSNGKTLLGEIYCRIAFGANPVMTSPGERKEELDKRIQMALTATDGPPLIFFDNFNKTTLANKDLDVALTSPESHRVRLFGTGVTRPVAPRSFIFANGNALALGADLVRRMLMISLDAKMENAEQRPLDDVGFKDEVLAHRAEILGDVATIWRWGRLNPSALRRGKRLGNFGQWCDWVRDPLLSLGCIDPVDFIGEAKRIDPERENAASIFSMWWTKHGRAPMEANALDAELKELIDPHGKTRQSLAAKVRALVGVRVAGYVLDANIDVRPTRYTLENASDKRSDADRSDTAPPRADDPHVDVSDCAEPPVPQPPEPRAPEFKRPAQPKPHDNRVIAHPPTIELPRGHDIIAAWRAGWATLDANTPPCPGLSADRWRGVHRVGTQFLDPDARPCRALTAVECGWTVLGLFGVHRELGAVRGDCSGAILVSGGLSIIAVTAQVIRFQSGLAAYHQAMNESICMPVWDQDIAP
jgi:hypothetical protein